MKTAQYKFTSATGWTSSIETSGMENAQLILAFGSTELIKEGTHLSGLREKFPHAVMIGGTSAGEIFGVNVLDDSIIATVVQFDKVQIRYTCQEISDVSESFEVGKKIVANLKDSDLRHVFVVSEGLNINGSELVRGLRSELPNQVTATGGLAGDGPNFHETFILDSDGMPKNKMVSAIGFYGDQLQIGYGSLGGWDSFGVERLVSRSKDNILYELDGKPALELYKSFLGEHAANLPASGLLFPLNMRIGKDSLPVVRTILAVNEEDQSLTFAGDIPEGAYVRLMKANFDRLIDGAVGAAEKTLLPNGEHADLAILISCVGRKLVLKQMIEEEVEGVRDVLGEDTTLCGFYSYGEISPFSKDAKCELHNQTMTITTLSES